jgi:hypothetical protein
MKTLSSKFFLVSAKIAPQIKFALFIVTLVLFVLAAGAPQATGSVGG